MENGEIGPDRLTCLEEAIDVNDERFAERQAKALATKKIHDEISARQDLTIEEKQHLECRTLTSLEDTILITKAGLLAKIIAAEESTKHTLGTPHFGEGLLLGIHWTTHTAPERIYPSIYGQQEFNGEPFSFRTIVWKHDHYQFLPEELETVAAIADLKAYWRINKY